MAKPLLTKKKQAWVDQFKPTAAIKGATLNNNAAVQDRYVKALNKLVVQMTRQTSRSLIRFFKSDTASEFFAQDASTASQARILTNAIQAKFEQLFNAKASGLAWKMVDDADKASSAQLFTSLKEMSGGLSMKTTVLTGPLKDITTAAVAENVALIKSIASQYMTQVNGAVMRSITTGNGLQELIPALQKYEGITVRRARNIAIDQTRKTFNTINKGRMQKLGVSKYEWIHSGGGQRPRQHHIELSGQIFSFDDPPVIDENTGERGIPGQLPNCGCTMRPVVTFDEGVQE